MWTIDGQLNDALPIVGQIYIIKDKRKGNFVGKIVSLSLPFAEVEVLAGKINWVSTENQMFNPNPKVVSIRDSLTRLIPQPTSPTSDEINTTPIRR